MSCFRKWLDGLDDARGFGFKGEGVQGRQG